MLAAVAQLLLGAGLFWLGRWGRLSADSLAPSRMHEDEHKIRADAIARGGLFCQGAGMLLLLFAIVTVVAASLGAAPTLRPQ